MCGSDRHTCLVAFRHGVFCFLFSFKKQENKLRWGLYLAPSRAGAQEAERIRPWLVRRLCYRSVHCKGLSCALPPRLPSHWPAVPPLPIPSPGSMPTPHLLPACTGHCGQTAGFATRPHARAALTSLCSGCVPGLSCGPTCMCSPLLIRPQPHVSFAFATFQTTPKDSAGSMGYRRIGWTR